MAKFSYTALDELGEKVHGVEAAPTVREARLALAEQGLRPIKVVEKTSILQFELTPKRVPREEIMHFSRQLAVFVRAGIPIMEALQVIAEETSEKHLQKVIIDLIEELYHGETFAKAASMHPEAFPNYYVGILQSAELTGNLDEVLNQLADYIARDLDARKKLTAAMIYPGIVFTMAILVVVVLAAFVLPRFTTFFTSLHAKLPLPTRMLLTASGAISTYWYILLGGFIAIVVGIISMRRSERGRAQLDHLLLRTPVIGGLIQAAVIERTCRVLATMIDTGVPLPEAMTVAADCASNAVYRQGLEDIRDQMMEGQGLAAPLARTGLFPGAAHQMFRVGEETGTLNLQLETAAEYYKRELDIKVQHFTSLFEPAIIIFVGVVVGFVAVALVSAMYGVYNQVNNT